MVKKKTKKEDIKHTSDINFEIDDGDLFYAHEFAINFNPSQVILDFKSVTPRIDVRSKDGPLLKIAHNVVLADPYHAKQFLGLFARAIKRYEEEFGEIKKPEAVQKAEKKMKRMKKKKAEVEIAPSYLG